jgi:hypothetical protein
VITRSPDSSRPLRIGELLRTGILRYQRSLQSQSLNPLRIGELLRTIRTDTKEIGIFYRSQSPSRRGTSSNVVCDFFKIVFEPKSQSPSHQGTSSHTPERSLSTEDSKSVSIPFASGNPLQRLESICFGDSIGSFNPLHIGEPTAHFSTSTHPTILRRFNPLRIGELISAIADGS